MSAYPMIFLRWLMMFVVDMLRYGVPASIAFFICWTWKWDALAHRRSQVRRPSNKAFKRELMYSAITGLVFATVGTATYTLSHAGYLQMYWDIHAHSWGYWAFSIAFAIVFHDAYFYWTHRAMHHKKLFKLFHRAHHLSTSPSPWAAYAFGPLEALVLALVVPLILLIIPMHQSALFVFLMYMILMNVVGHNGFELYPKWFARSRWTGWYSTATHHNLHHRDFKGNYGLYFTWWDRLMGTEHADYHAEFDKITATPLLDPPAPAISDGVRPRA